VNEAEIENSDVDPWDFGVQLDTDQVEDTEPNMVDDDGDWNKWVTQTTKRVVNTKIDLEDSDVAA